MGLIQEAGISVPQRPPPQDADISLQSFVKCMGNGLAIMHAPSFSVMEDPKATAGLGGNRDLLDVRSSPTV